MRRAEFLAVIALVIVSFSGHAKTLHVAKWGEDDPSSASKPKAFKARRAAGL